MYFLVDGLKALLIPRNFYWSIEIVEVLWSVLNKLIRGEIPERSDIFCCGKAYILTHEVHLEILRENSRRLPWNWRPVEISMATHGPSIRYRFSLEQFL
jgi:hypothetical protein